MVSVTLVLEGINLRIALSVFTLANMLGVIMVNKFAFPSE